VLPTTFPYPSESLGASPSRMGDTSPEKPLFWNGLRAGGYRIYKLCPPVPILRLAIQLFHFTAKEQDFIPVKTKKEVSGFRGKDMPNM